MRPGEVAAAALQRTQQVLLAQTCGRPELHRLVRPHRGLEGAVGDQRMQMDVHAQVTAEPLHHDEHSGMRGAAAAQPMRALGPRPNRLHHPLGNPLPHTPKQRPIVAQPRRHRPLEAKHPLPPRDLGQAVLHQQRRGLGHTPAHA